MKRKRIRARISLLLAFLLAVVTAAPAAAESIGNGHIEIHADRVGSIYSSTDLFGKFKDVMPGDVREQNILVKNASKEYDYLKIYLQAVAHTPEGNPISEKVADELTADQRRGARTPEEYMAEFLRQMTLTVTVNGEVAEEATVDDCAKLEEGVLLGTVRKDETIALDAKLTVPPEMGNDYQTRIGEVDWLFTTEGYYDPAPVPENDAVLTVRKVWVDDGKTDRPETVRIRLIGDGKVKDEAELNAGNQWTHTWDKLKNAVNWDVEEVDVPEGYQVTYEREGHMVTVINRQTEAYHVEPKPGPEKPEKPKPKPEKPEPPVAEPVNLTVQKAWDDDGHGRPKAVKMTLYNGGKAVETVSLGAWNQWRHTWRKLDGEGRWQVLETEIPRGYTPSYRVHDGVVTVTNTEALIHTGQWKWPVPVLFGAGGLFLGIGVYRRRRSKR